MFSPSLAEQCSEYQPMAQDTLSRVFLALVLVVNKVMIPQLFLQPEDPVRLV